MVNVSPDLLWMLVKDNNRFLVKRNGNSSASLQFSSEPNNLYNLNSFKYSGLANKKTIAITSTGEDSHIVLTTTKMKKLNRPSNAYASSVVKGDIRKKVKVVANEIEKNKYRPDLKRAALARLTAVYKSLKATKAKKKTTRAGKNKLYSA